MCVELAKAQGYTPIVKYNFDKKLTCLFYGHSIRTQSLSHKLKIKKTNNKKMKNCKMNV